MSAIIEAMLMVGGAPPSVTNSFMFLGQVLPTEDSTTVSASLDGISWSSQTSVDPVDITLNGITYSPALGLFVAVGNDINTGEPSVQTSTGNGTWTKHLTPAAMDQGPQAVAWSQALGLFVCSGGNTGTPTSNLMTSPDGVTWTLRTNSSTAIPGHLLWANSIGKFIGLDTFGDITSSFNGTSWTPGNIGTQVTDFAWAEQLGLAVVVNNANSYTATNGVTYTTHTGVVSGVAFAKIVWCPALTLFVAVTGLPVPHAYTSPNGITFTDRGPITGLTDNPLVLAWSESIGKVVVAATDGSAAYSSDGITWTSATVNPSSLWVAGCSTDPGT